MTLRLRTSRRATRRPHETGDFSSSLDLATGSIVVYTPTPPDPDLVDAVEAAAAPALVQWEEGTSVAY